MATKTNKRICISSQACSFCKKRHLKCDGHQPCTQCEDRGIECVFETNAKRGRKSTKSQNDQGTDSVILYKNPYQIWTNENYHSMFITCYIQTTGFYFPHANLQSIQLSDQSFTISNPNLWTKIENFEAHKSQMTVQELYQAIEYLAICGLGARVSLNSLDVMNLFYQRIEKILQVISFILIRKEEFAMADNAINTLMIAFFGYIQLDALAHARFCIFQSLSILNLNKHGVRRDTRNRLYINVTATSDDIDDKLHFLSLVEDTEPLTTNSVINLLYATAVIVSTYLALQVECKVMSIPQKDQILYEKLFGFLEKGEKYIHEIGEYNAAIKECLTISSGFKAYLLEKLGKSEIAQVHAKLAISNMLTTDPRSHIGVALALLICVTVLKKKEDVTMFVPSISKWMETSQSLNPAITKILEALIPSKARVIEEVDEKTTETPATEFTEEELEALLFGSSNVNNVL